ncbi:MAG: DUF2238 domain-containing protein [Dokdonella sp.]
MDMRKHERIDLSNGASARWPLVMLVIFVVVMVISSIDPTTREDWLLENILVALALPLLLWGWRRVRLSNAAYSLLFVFGVLHEIGAHYQYAEVPYEQWVAAISGGGSLNALFGFERNQFDRLVHFLYGVLVTPAVVEVICAQVVLRGAWRFLLPAGFMMTHGMIYEIIEMIAAVMVGGDLCVAYLGTQGDAWDAQKDMALAAVGVILILPYWLHRLRKSDY